MRGLDTRVLLAKARIAEIAHPHRDDDDMLDVWREAYCEGACDFETDEAEPPVMFANERMLLTAWREGYADRALLRSMEICPLCRDPNTDFCVYHD